jgi:polysaccharide biosynthesis transport protein
MDFLEYFKILKRRRWLLIIPILIIGTMTTFVGFLTPKRYSASMVLIIEEAFTSDRLLEGLVAPTDASSRLNVIKETIASDSFAERLIAKLKEGGKLGPSSDWSSIKNSIQHEATVELITRSIRPTANDLVLRFNFTMDDKKATPIVLQAIADGFIEESTRPQKEATQAASDFLHKQVKEFESELQAVELQVQDYKRNHFDAMPGAYDQRIVELNGLYRQLNELTISEKELEAKRQDIITQLVKKNPQLTRLKAELSQAAARYTDQHPLVQNLRQQLVKLEERLIEDQKAYQETGEFDVSKFLAASDDEYNRMVALYGVAGRAELAATGPSESNQTAATVSGDAVSAMAIANVEELQQAERQLTMLRARKKATQDAITRLTGETADIPEKEQRYADLMRIYTTLLDRYTKAYQRLQDAKISGELNYIDSLQRFKILQKPRPEGAPIQAPKVKLLMVGIILALVSGLGLAFLIEFFDTRIYNVRQFSKQFPIPVLGQINNQFKRSQSDE